MSASYKCFCPYKPTLHVPKQLHTKVEPAESNRMENVHVLSTENIAYARPNSSKGVYATRYRKKSKNTDKRNGAVPQVSDEGELFPTE
jgi:hypothetical protein